MWEKGKSTVYGTTLNAKIELGGHKTLNATLKYVPMSRYQSGGPYGIALDFLIDEWEVKDYGSGPFTVRKWVLDFANMPKGCLVDGFNYEKRTIGPLNQQAKRYPTPESVLEAFRRNNPDIQIGEVKAAGEVA